MKITRRNFLGLAAAVAVLPTALLEREAAPARAKVRVGRAPSQGASRKPSREAYLDESGSAADEYRVAGLLLLDSTASKRLSRLIRRHRGAVGELKWNRVNGANLLAHKQVIDAVFAAIARRELQFMYSIAAGSDVSWRSAPTDIGYSRAVEAIMTRCAAVHRDSHRIYVYPQRRRSPGSLNALRETTNGGVSSRRLAKSPIRLVQYRDASDSILNQVVDVLVGGLAFRLNGARANWRGNSGKRELAEYITSRVSPASLVTI